VTSNEYRNALEFLCMSQGAAAVFFEVDERTSRRWACGEVDIPHAVELMLNYMVRKNLTPEDIILG